MNSDTNTIGSNQIVSPNIWLASEIESELTELFNKLRDDKIDVETLRKRIDNLMTKRELLKKYQKSKERANSLRRSLFICWQVTANGAQRFTAVLPTDSRRPSCLMSPARWSSNAPHSKRGSSRCYPRSV